LNIKEFEFSLFRGLKDSIDVAKYRFNKPFHLIGAEEFLKDLFNNAGVCKFSALTCVSPGTITGVKFKHMNCDVLNMSFFDVFQEANVTMEDGTIRQYYEERYEGMILGDKMRQVMVWEEYEDPDAWELIHQDKY